MRTFNEVYCRTSFCKVILGVCCILLLGSVVYSQSNSILINDIAWNSHGSLLAIAYDDGTLEIASETTSTVLNISQERVLSVAWNPVNMSQLAVSSFRGPVKIVEMVGGQYTITHDLLTGTFVGKVEWSPNGSYLAILGATGGGASSISSIQVWDTTMWEQSATYEDGYTLTDIAWNPQTPPRLLITGVENNFGAEIALWDVENDTTLWTVEELNSGVLYAVWNPVGNYFATSTETPESALVRIHDGASGLPVSTIPTDLIYRGSLSWSPSSYLAISDFSEIEIWNVEPNKLVASYQTSYYVSTVVWNPDGSNLAYGGSSGTMEIVSAPSVVACTITFPTADCAALKSAIIMPMVILYPALYVLKAHMN